MTLLRSSIHFTVAHVVLFSEYTPGWSGSRYTRSCTHPWKVYIQHWNRFDACILLHFFIMPTNDMPKITSSFFATAQACLLYLFSLGVFYQAYTVPARIAVKQWEQTCTAEVGCAVVEKRWRSWRTRSFIAVERNYSTRITLNWILFLERCASAVHCCHDTSYFADRILSDQGL